MSQWHFIFIKMPRHAQPDTAIHMPLGTFSNKRSHIKKCMRSILHSNFRKVHQGGPCSGNDKVMYRFVYPGSSLPSQTCRLLRRPLKTVGIILIPLVLPISTITHYSFVLFNFCWYQHKRQNQVVKAPLPWVEFKAFFQKSFSGLKAFMDTI